MYVSPEQNDEGWVDWMFGIQVNRCKHYPFSKDPALIYRLKLAVVLLSAAYTLWRMEESCLQLSFLLNCWLLFVTCDTVFRNYPWREPLKVWMWQLYMAIPYSRVVFFICIVLLLQLSTYLGTGCELHHPLVAASVVWLCCMLIWPLERERRRREEKSEEDYDQFSSTRPFQLMLPGSLQMISATLCSPSLFALLAALTTIWLSTLFLRSDLWTASTSILALGCFAILCCHRLPEDVGRTLAAWEVEEASYARWIENHLRIVRSHLRTSGFPDEGSTRFHRLAIQVPLLLREAKILWNANSAISESRVEELRMLTSAEELVEFHEMLECYGPYSTKCCIS